MTYPNCLSCVDPSCEVRDNNDLGRCPSFRNPNFSELGYNHGKLSQQYQPVPFPLPTPCKDCTEQELLSFWVGFDKGWTESEQDNVIFTKEELSWN